MKRYMKRIVLLLCINLLTAIVCSSQTIYPQIASDSTVIISHKQLKQTNLIFLEHNKLILENQELKSQLNNYSDLVSNYQTNDSIKNTQISLLRSNLDKYNTIIETQNTQIKKLRSSNKLYKGITIGSFAISFGLLILFITK